MKDKKIYIILTILALIALLLAWQYLLSVYEVTYSVDNKRISADNQSTVSIEVIPVNSVGWKAPFRTSSADFEITEGADLVETINDDPENGIFTFRAKDKSGKVVIRVKSEHSLLPSDIEIFLEPNAA